MPGFFATGEQVVGDLAHVASTSYTVVKTYRYYKPDAIKQTVDSGVDKLSKSLTVLLKNEKFIPWASRAELTNEHDRLDEKGDQLQESISTLQGISFARARKSYDLRVEADIFVRACADHLNKVNKSSSELKKKKVRANIRRDGEHEEMIQTTSEGCHQCGKGKAVDLVDNASTMVVRTASEASDGGFSFVQQDSASENIEGTGSYVHIPLLPSIAVTEHYLPIADLSPVGSRVVEAYELTEMGRDHKSTSSSA